MSETILKYHPDMDKRLAELLNVGWARLRELPLLHAARANWPIVTDELLAQWHESDRLSEAGTFVAEDDEGSLVAVFAASAGAGDQGTLHFFCVIPDYVESGYGPRTLAAAEAYLRDCGMKAVLTEQIDSRSHERNDFLREHGYYDPDPENRSMTMLLRPEGHRLREVVLPDSGYRLVNWRDEYLRDWLRIRNAVFDGGITEQGFLDGFRSRECFDPDAWFFMRHNDEFVGITNAVVRREEDDTVRGGYFTGVGVLPEYRGRKLGEALVVAALNYLVERGIRPIALNTEPFRKAAIGLYEKLDFEFASFNYRYRKDL